MSCSRAAIMSAALSSRVRRCVGVLSRHVVKAAAAESQARVAVAGVAETAWWMGLLRTEDVTGKRAWSFIECAAPFIQSGTMGRPSWAEGSFMKGMVNGEDWVVISL